MYNIKEEFFYADQDDIGGHLLYEREGDSYDWKCQIMREKARLAFFVCFVPYKETYKKSELETILITANNTNGNRWTKCAPDLFIGADVEYFIGLCKEYLNAEYENDIISFKNSKQWTSIFNYEISNPTPEQLFKNIYTANCRLNWKTMNDEEFIDMIITDLNSRMSFSKNNAKSVYRNLKYLEIGLTLGEFLPNKENTFNEIKEYTNRIKNLKSNVIETLRTRIYNYSKQLNYDILTGKPNTENYLSKNIAMHAKVYNMIVKKNIYY